MLGSTSLLRKEENIMIPLYKEYEPETLKKLQHLELKILKDFDRICIAVYRLTYAEF